MPGQAQGMPALEKLFYDFTSKVAEIIKEIFWKKNSDLKDDKKK